MKIFKKQFIHLGFFAFLVVLFSLGQLQRIELVTLPAFYLHDILIGIWLLFTVFTYYSQIKKVVSRKIKKVKNNFTFKVAVAFFGWVVLGWVLSLFVGDLNNNAVFYLIRFSIYSLMLIFIGKFKLLSSRILTLGFLASGFYLLLFGFWQYLFLPDVRFLEVFGWDNHYYRMIGSQFDPNFLGILFVILFFSIIELKFFGKKILGVIKSIFLTSIILGLALTFSRASYLSFLVGILVYAVRKSNLREKFVPFIFAGLLALFIFIAPKPGGEGVNLARTASIEARISSSRIISNELSTRELVFGRGLFNQGFVSLPSKYQTDNHANLSDNIVLLALSSTGFVGLGLISWLIGSWLLYLRRNKWHQFLLIVVVLLHAVFNNTIFQPFVFLFLGWALLLDYGATIKLKI